MKPVFAITVIFLLCTSFAFTGTVAHAQIEPTPVQCGMILESEFTEDRMDENYVIELAPRDLLSVAITMLNPNVVASIRIWDPSETVIDSSIHAGEVRVGEVIIGGTGTYRIEATGFGVGIYTMAIGCTLADGTVIEPGDVIVDVEPEQPAENPPLAEVPAFGFPGVPPRDFAAAIEIPLMAGQPQTVPVASDVILYTYEATAGQSASLTATRVSGDISAGVVVINRNTNEIVFMGVMPFTDTLSATMTFPADGTYAIGIFRVDTPTLAGTSGAVQISIE